MNWIIRKFFPRPYLSGGLILVVAVAITVIGYGMSIHPQKNELEKFSGTLTKYVPLHNDKGQVQYYKLVLENDQKQVLEIETESDLLEEQKITGNLNKPVTASYQNQILDLKALYELTSESETLLKYEDTVNYYASTGRNLLIAAVFFIFLGIFGIWVGVTRRHIKAKQQAA